MLPVIYPIDAIDDLEKIEFEDLDTGIDTVIDFNDDTFVPETGGQIETVRLLERPC